MHVQIEADTGVVPHKVSYAHASLALLRNSLLDILHMQVLLRAVYRSLPMRCTIIKVTTAIYYYIVD